MASQLGNFPKKAGGKTGSSEESTWCEKLEEKLGLRESGDRDEKVVPWLQIYVLPKVSTTKFCVI